MARPGKARKGKPPSYFRLRRQRRIGLWIAAIAVVLVGSITATVLSTYFSPLGLVGSAHDHVDFKLYLDGQAVDFSQAKCQARHSNVHVEGGDGDVIHIHSAHVTMGGFFETLGIQFNGTCLVMDAGEAYCSGEGKTLKFYVNERPNGEFDRYVLRHLDRILVSYGDESEADLQQQLASVTRKAAAQG